MPAVREAVADDWHKMETGVKSAVDVAVVSMSRARRAKSASGRFLLMKGAVDLNVRAGDVERAAEALAAMRAEFPDMSDKTMRSIAGATANADRAAEVVARSVALRDAWNFPNGFVTPLLRTLRLGGDAEIDFCAIPPGEFRMSNAGGRGTHKVKLTRPFWMTRTYVTDRQLCTAFPSRRRNERAEKCEETFPEMDVASFRMFAADYEDMCEALNDRFAGCIPEGYVFRLPTEAELEYALRQGDGEAALVRAEHLTGELCMKRGCASGGIRLLPRDKANGWGLLVGFVEAMHVMDCVDVSANRERSFRYGMTADAEVVNAIASYADGEIDPVRRGGWRMVRFLSKDRILARRHWGLARIVIGPMFLNEYPK